MARLIRRIAALTAAYAIALQAMLSGVVSAAPAGFDPSVLCTGGSASDATPPSHHDVDCQACPLACGGGAPALTPSGAAVAPVRLAAGATARIASPRTLPPHPKHRLQASRAPPSGP